MIFGVLGAISSVITLVANAVEKFGPLVGKVMTRILHPTYQQKPEYNPNCIPPICGEPPNYCPEQELVSACRQKIATIETTLFRRTTLALNLNDDDDDTTDKSSTSTSTNSSVMLILVILVGLAIIGFLYMRFRQGNNKNNSNDRKSSTWSV